MAYVSDNQTKLHEFTATAYTQPAEPVTVSLTLTPDTSFFWRPTVAISGGSPAGGTYSGDGVTDPSGIFSPMDAWYAAGLAAGGQSQITVTITYTAPSGATATDDMTVMFPAVLPPSGLPPMWDPSIDPLGMVWPDASAAGMGFDTISDNGELVPVTVPSMLAEMPPNQVWAWQNNAVTGEEVIVAVGPEPAGMHVAPLPGMIWFSWTGAAGTDLDDFSNWNDYAIPQVLQYPRDANEAAATVYYSWDGLQYNRTYPR